MSQTITPQATHDRSKVWAYFKQSKNDPNKVRCNLCSTDLLCNKGGTTINILWNHVKFKHSNDGKKMMIVNNNHESDNQGSSSTTELLANNMTQAKLRHINNNTNRTYDHHHNNQTTTNHIHVNNTNNIVDNRSTSNQLQTSKNLRNNLDLNFNDLSLTSMKPLPSSSLSSNLISRLNQLSLPFTRKLKFWNKKSFQVNQYDPSFKVIYLGNLGMQLWSKDESYLDKPLSTLWNNYLVNMKTEIVMRLTICNSGLKAITRQHGLTQYWSNRLVYCCSHKNYPKIFSWIYRHEGKKMRQELRCHAVLCPSPDKASKMVILLNQRLACALQEFRREKKSRGLTIVGNSSNVSTLHQTPRTIPLRRQILAKGSANFRPPLERSKSAPKLTSILEENYDSDDQTSHDEFEFEESFGDRDDDSDYDNGVLVKGEDADEEEDDTHKLESNSFNTTELTEDTSNDSSVCANGDMSSFDKQESKNEAFNEKLNGVLIDKSVNKLITRVKLTNDDSSTSEDYQKRNTKETFEYPTQTATATNFEQPISISHKPLNIRRSSANINTSSSFENKLVVSDQGKDNEGDTVSIRDVNSSLISDLNLLKISEAKNNNSSKKPESQTTVDQADEVSTQEIILSWSNLVIR